MVIFIFFFPFYHFISQLKLNQIKQDIGVALLQPEEFLPARYHKPAVKKENLQSFLQLKVLATPYLDYL